MTLLPPADQEALEGVQRGAGPGAGPLQQPQSKAGRASPSPLASPGPLRGGPCDFWMSWQGSWRAHRFASCEDLQNEVFVTLASCGLLRLARQPLPGSVVAQGARVPPTRPGTAGSCKDVFGGEDG